MFSRLCALVVAICLCGLAAPAQVAPTQIINSAVLKEERSYQVALPDSYGWAKDRRYPVLYVLDGPTHFAHTSASVGFLAEHGEIPEMIVVAIASTVRIRDFTQTDWSTAWVGGGGAENFKRFLATELIPQVEKAYRTNGFRVLSGHSAGGQFALHCVSSEPALFQGYFALAPSLDWDGNLPQRQLDKFLKSTPNLRAFLYVARADDFGRPLADYEALVKTMSAASPRGFRWHGDAFPDETHVSVPLLAQINALRRLYDGYRFHNDLLQKGLPFAEKHFQDVSKRVGYSIAIPEGVINSFGYAALEEGKIQEAIALFRRNVEANPNSANAYDSLADGYAKAEDWEEAARASEQSLKLAIEFDNPNRAYFERQVAKWKGRLTSSPAKPR